MFMKKANSSEKKILYISFILIQSLVYGIGNPLTKVAYHSISPLWLLAARYCLLRSFFLLSFTGPIPTNVSPSSLSPSWGCFSCAAIQEHFPLGRGRL